VLARLVPRLPSVAGKLFLTFTVNPALYADPSAAFEHSRQKLRRVFYELRQGVPWEGKVHQLKAPYAVKVEFHGNEWAHFHAIFLTRRFLPPQLLDNLWKLGRTNISRISNERFRYLLKYVTKGGSLPDWVKNRNRLRVFQASRDFLKPIQQKPPPGRSVKKTRRSSGTIGDRITRQQKTAVLQLGSQFAQIALPNAYAEMHGERVLKAAEEGRYLGNAQYLINDSSQLLDWLNSK